MTPGILRQIDRRREELGLSLGQLSRMAGYARSRLSTHLRGRDASAYRKIEDLAHALGCHVALIPTKTPLLPPEEIRKLYRNRRYRDVKLKRQREQPNG